jgi:8-oxo-dGTP pyrophosphatase MutT (NUDIX family)
MSVETLSCGVVLARETPEGYRTLMLRAFQHWDFPKGMSEGGEAPLETALRELREETGIETTDFAWGDRFIETGPYSRGKTARYYLAKTTEQEVAMGLSPETGKPEHHEWRWVSFDEAFDLSAPRVRTVVTWARQIIGT